jgi:TonB family protein
MPEAATRGRRSLRHRALSRSTITFVVLAAIATACVTPPPELASFPARAGAVWSADCCGDPIVQTKPEYPAAALRSGQDGWVIVSGILDERGWVTNPIVLAAEPEGVFDEAARKAFDAWRYAAPTDRSSPREVRAVLQFRRPRAATPAMGPSGGGGMSGGGGSGY